MTILWMPVIGVVGLVGTELFERFCKSQFCKGICLYTLRALEYMI
jgi:hypothetical protein